MITIGMSTSSVYPLSILSVHAPGLGFCQLVWGLDPVRKLEKSAELTVAGGAKTVAGL